MNSIYKIKINYLIKLFSNNVLLKKLIILLIDFSIPISFVLINIIFNLSITSGFSTFKIEFLIFYSYVIFFIIFDLYSFRIRILSQTHYFKIILAVICNLIFLIIISNIFSNSLFNLELIFIFNLYLITILLTSRIFIFLFIDFFSENKKYNCLIYGAGINGVFLLTRLNDYNVVAFVDDDKSKHHTKTNGVKIFPTNKIKELVNDYNITNIFISISNFDKNKKIELLNNLNKSSVKVQILKSYTDQINSNGDLDIFDTVTFEEIFSRNVYKNTESISKFINNKNIIITGAGGSIGSEMCNQLLQFYPKKLILIDHSENNLFIIYESLKKLKSSRGLNTDIHPVICNLRNINDIKRIFESYDPEVFFHVGAYKHVPLLEENYFEAFQNNVNTTFNILNCFKNFPLEKFIYVSSDKAVRPNNIMGATKRFSEKLILSFFNNNNISTNCAIVRFGNVFNSNGSVIEIFNNQIKENEPLTITNKEMYRYFMKISEAAILVLEAASSQLNNKIFVLNMGDPVNIFDLAKKIYYQSTLKNNKNEKFNYKIIGLRPGEKLKEELFINLENRENYNDNIYIENEKPIEWKLINNCISDINENINKNDHLKFRKNLSNVVENFK